MIDLEFLRHVLQYARDSIDNLLGSSYIPVPRVS